MAALLLLLARLDTPLHAQEATPSAERELVVGVTTSPPFAIKATDGSWQGISVELWRKIANDLDLRYRFVEKPHTADLIEGVAGGGLDVAAAALTVTAARERQLDFTPSYFSTGFGIAVSAGGEATWAPVLRALTSFGFVQSIITLIALALIVGIVVWFFERRHNEQFGGGVARGLSSSVWWTTVAMTQRGIGNFGPRTLPGRAIAMLWMVGSIIAIAIFTASVTTVLTVKQLRGVVHDVGDLSEVRVATVRNTATEGALAQMQISATLYPSLREALLALRAGTIDAVVHDKALLGWQVHQDFRTSVELLEVTFRPQHYAFALRPNFAERKAVSVAMLDAVQSRWWEQMVYRYVGAR
jgi:ABC-type amino acid transport substrate-binding protein